MNSIQDPSKQNEIDLETVKYQSRYSAVYDYIHQKDEFSPIPDTNDTTCRICYKWKPYPKGQEHFGYAWWRRCTENCSHEHHKNEIPIA